jgi:hypothetical protein
MATEAQGAAVAGLSSLGNEPDRYRYPNWGALDKPFAGEEAAAGLYAAREPAEAGEAATR